MDPHSLFCPNPDCPARGQIAQGNITIHSQAEQRYRCTACGKTFCSRKGTVFYRRYYAGDLISLVVCLVAHGCPISAIVVALCLHPRTVRSWVKAAGCHAEAVHHHLVETPRDLGCVQADEIRLVTQSGIYWVAMAIQVVNRLWLGGVVSAHRDKTLIRKLADQIARCAVQSSLLLVADGLSSYVGAFLRSFRTREPGRCGRPRLVSWPGLVIGQVIKLYAPRRGRGSRWWVSGVVHRVAYGSAALCAEMLAVTQGSAGVLNTAYIERLNATFRQHLAAWGRRSRHQARREGSVTEGMYLVGGVYNFCLYHQSLTLRGERTRQRTPAMAAGLSDHRWNVEELLSYHVPLPRWKPPKRKGRRSKELQEQIKRWAA